MIFISTLIFCMAACLLYLALLDCQMWIGYLHDRNGVALPSYGRAENETHHFISFNGHYYMHINVGQL